MVFRIVYSEFNRLRPSCVTVVYIYACGLGFRSLTPRVGLIFKGLRNGKLLFKT